MSHRVTGYGWQRVAGVAGVGTRVASLSLLSIPRFLWDRYRCLAGWDEGRIGRHGGGGGYVSDDGSCDCDPLGDHLRSTVRCSENWSEMQRTEIIVGRRPFPILRRNPFTKYEYVNFKNLVPYVRRKFHCRLSILKHSYIIQGYMYREKRASIRLEKQARNADREICFEESTPTCECCTSRSAKTFRVSHIAWVSVHIPTSEC